MSGQASELAGRLAREAEAVCRHYLSNGRRQGGYWLVGDVANTPGRSLFVRLRGPTVGKGAAGRWCDAATGEHGDLLDLIALRLGLPLRAALDEARHWLRLPGIERRRQERANGSSDGRERCGSFDTVANARRLWRDSRAIHGTPAEAYLQHRGISDHALANASSLRFHPRAFFREHEEAEPRRLPALVCAVTDEVGALTGVSRVYLSPDGRIAQVPEPKRMLGRVRGGAVRFSGSSNSRAIIDPAATLVVGEGVETMLSIRTALTHMPVAAALSTAHLAAFVPSASLKRLWIARDAGPPGERAALRLQDRLREERPDLLVRNLVPCLNDFNEDLGDFGEERLASILMEQLGSHASP